MRSLTLALLATLTSVSQTNADDWMQWGRSAQHDSNPQVFGQRLERIEAQAVIDPFSDFEQQAAGGDLLVHYQVPLIDGDDVFLEQKFGSFIDPSLWQSQSWRVRDMRWIGSNIVQQWSFNTDWKPVPPGSPSWEPVFHCAVSADAVWVPALGGTMQKISRIDGTPLVPRINPFGPAIDSAIFVSGPPTIDNQGNVFYNAIKLDSSSPYGNDVVNAWLVRIGADGSVKTATYASLTPNAPARNAPCTSLFNSAQLPFPPSPNALAPTITCGGQRPGINVAPAVAPDGTIYTMSRVHFTSLWSYLVAVNPDLTPKWMSSLRNRMSDGCNVTLPANGSPGGCRNGATTGVDPNDNQMPSGRVFDDATSSPVVTPDGKILYGAYTRYNYAQGHLMMFDSDGSYIGAYGWGWDLTPAIYRHDGTYSILLKENHYSLGSYCDNTSVCPPNRTTATPNDPEQFFITQLSSTLQVEWRHKSTNTQSCLRDSTGAIQCASDHPHGFEWCVNAIAVDARGVVYANSEDGNIYAIDQGGVLRQSLFLRLALGAAYTPLSIGHDGRIYTQNAGDLFVVSANPRRRPARQQ
jgi:outer membrane protein assembly factor BamB